MVLVFVFVMIFKHNYTISKWPLWYFHEFHVSDIYWFFGFIYRYNKAVRWFEKTLAHIPSSLSEMWEPTVVNLAHACRKLKLVITFLLSSVPFCNLLRIRRMKMSGFKLIK